MQNHLATCQEETNARARLVEGVLVIDQKSLAKQGAYVIHRENH